MSRRHHDRKRRRELRSFQVQEIDAFGATPRLTNKASRIMDWILFGNEDGREAMHELFPLPGNVKRNDRV